jgi:V/A-type H+/Na+-transporting ATPase subunit A
MTRGKLTAIISNLASIEIDGPVGQNEICYILHGDAKLMSEVIRISGVTAYAQVFESTRGIRIGSKVEFTGGMLEITLGPGLLSRNYDGLQNDLDKLSGLFLKRGEYSYPLNEDSDIEFTPLAKTGDAVTGGDWLGSVKENWIDHKIMVPLKWKAGIR